MEYMTAQNAGVKWNITRRRVQILCAQNRVAGAVKVANLWLIPNATVKPADLRHVKPQDSCV